MKNNPALLVENLAVGYGHGKNRQEVLCRLNLKAHPGELIALMGANGTGKSTLIRTLASLQPVLSGDVWINQRNFKELSPKDRAKQVSVVLTDRVQPGYLTVGDLVALGRHPYTDWRGNLSKKDNEAVLQALEVTGLTSLIHADLHSLSDGQKQKALIARAMAQDGDLMILDEPLIHLDIPSKWEIMKLLQTMAHENSKTIIVATHELDLSLKMADKLWVIDPTGQLSSGTPEDLALDGVISRMFSHRQYAFDSDEGINSTKSSGTEIKVTGTGNMLSWTQKALERIGYQPVDKEIVPEVLCLEQVPLQWQLTTEEKAKTCYSIGELIASLQDP